MMYEIEYITPKMVQSCIYKVDASTNIYAKKTFMQICRGSNPEMAKVTKIIDIRVV